MLLKHVNSQMVYYSLKESGFKGPDGPAKTMDRNILQGIKIYICYVNVVIPSVNCFTMSIARNIGHSRWSQDVSAVKGIIKKYNLNTEL